MTSETIVVEVNCATGEEIYRVATEQEIADAVARSAVDTARREEHEVALAAETAARESARTKLAALGLTEAEVAALVK